jgi:hypothetical protein
MYEAYFTRRLLQALALADEAASAEEKAIHLRASRYYRDLLQFPEKRLAIRHSVRIGAVLRHLGPEPRRIVISDLSTSGFRTELPMPVRPGTVVAVDIDGLAQLDAYVIWQEGSQVGLKFLTEIHPALLDAALAVGPHIE